MNNILGKKKKITFNVMDRVETFSEGLTYIIEIGEDYIKIQTKDFKVYIINKDKFLKNYYYRDYVWWLKSSTFL